MSETTENNESIQKTITVAVLLCLVCSVLVSASVVLLKPVQVMNKGLDNKTNILSTAGMLPPNARKAEIEQKFSEFTVKLVDLDAGQFVDAATLGLASADAFDQRRAAKDPKMSRVLSGEEDVAGIKRRERYAKVYLVEKDGKVERIILPVKGYGLWSTLYGYLALEGDGNTIIGLGFTDHAETPGLGGEVDNPLWKALWPGKKVYADGDLNSPVIELIKGTVDAADPKAPWKVDGLSGATLTSRGVTNLVHYWLGEQGFAKFLNNLRAGEV